MIEWFFCMIYVVYVFDELYIVFFGKILFFFIFLCLYVLKILIIIGYFKCNIKYNIK